MLLAIRNYCSIREVEILDANKGGHHLVLSAQIATRVMHIKGLKLKASIRSFTR